MLQFIDYTQLLYDDDDVFKFITNQCKHGLVQWLQLAEVKPSWQLTARVACVTIHLTVSPLIEQSFNTI